LKISHSNTLTVESLIHTLHQCGRSKVKPYDYKIIESISMNFSYTAQGMTEKQANLVLKILKKHVDTLNDAYKYDVMPFILNPTYKFPLRISITSSTIELIEDRQGRKTISLKFPYKEEIIKLIKDRNLKTLARSWNADTRSWELSLDTEALRLCMTLVDQYQFTYEPIFQNYFDQIKNIEQNFENYVPMVDYVDGKYQFRNTPPQIPQLNHEDLQHSLFQARRYGIFTWSDEVEKEMSKANLSSLTLDFLKHTKNEEFVIKLEDFTPDSLENLVKYLLPCMIFIPAGSELTRTRHAFDMLQKAGVENRQISTMFRLSNDTHSSFNKYIKENGLNSPITEDTKAVLVSQKIPKTVFQSDLKFPTAIVYNRYHAHYATKDFMRTFQNKLEIFDSVSPKKTENSMDWLLDV